MEKMKTLADQLREEMSKPGDRVRKKAEALDAKPPKANIRKTVKFTEAAILTALIAYDNSENKSMVHARFDKQTVDIMNKFKMATGIEVTKFVSFAVRNFLETHPELKTIIKQFIQNTDL
jgi:preprotein translocase subunit SecD